MGGILGEPIRYGPRVANEPAAAVTVDVDHVLAPVSRSDARFVFRGAAAIVLALQRVSHNLGAPPRRNDPAFQHRMRSSNEAVDRGDVCQLAFHSGCSLRQQVAAQNDWVRKGRGATAAPALSSC